MIYEVFIVSDAEKDILEIFDYIASNDSLKNAHKISSELERTMKSLSELPERGHYPPELERIAVYDFREIHYKPYRIMYRILGEKIIIHCVLDGRRNLSELLEKRLLR